jgi:hypothetical protein
VVAATALAAFAVIGIASSSAATQHLHHRHLFMMVPPQSQEIARPHSEETPRDAALRECSGKAEKWSDRDWETTKAATFANCMTDRGQVP